MKRPHNIEITDREIALLRELPAFDLRLLLSELNLHGWEVAREMLPHIEASLATRNIARLVPGPDTLDRADAEPGDGTDGR